MITVSTKKLSRIMRTHAPTVGIHLPTENERIAAHTANQMKISEKTYLPAPCSGVKKSPSVVTARMVSDPPSQIGFDSQYRTALTDAVKRPNASLVQT